MTDGDLPAGWSRPGFLRARRLRRQVLAELAPDAPLRQGLSVIAVAEGSDDVVLKARDGALHLLHLTWQAGVSAPQPLAGLADLAGRDDPPPGTVDAVSFWARADTATGLVMVEHQLDGGEALLPLDAPAGLPADGAALARAGWTMIEGPLAPRALLDGELRPTGQTVDYWARPVVDDFMLFRVLETPGEPLALRKLLPDDPAITEFDTRDALTAWAEAHRLVPVRGHVHPRFGLAGS